MMANLIKTFQNEFGLSYMGLRTIFVSTDVILFASENLEDQLVYALDDPTWNLIILGFSNNWTEVLDSYDTLVNPVSPKVGLVLSTSNNRILYKTGWRPPPMSKGRVYEDFVEHG